MTVRKKFSFIWVIVTLIVSLCLPSLVSFASTSRGLGISDNTVYYIMNYANKRLMAPNSDTDEVTNVTTWTAGDWQNPRTKWLVKKQSNGAYRLFSFGSTSHALRAYENNSVEVEYEESDGSVDFDICRINDGDYDGMYVIKWGDKYLSTASNSDAVILEEASSVTNEEGIITNVRCIWTFMAVEKRDATYYYFNHSNMNTSANAVSFYNRFESYGYDGYYVENLEDADFVTDYYIEQDDIFIFAGYGEEASIVFKDANGNKLGAVVADYETVDENNEYYLELDANALARSRCVILLGSNTASYVAGNDGNVYNLVDTIYSYGAHYVLGIMAEIEDDQINAWMTTFISRINNGANIDTAVTAANYASSMNNYVYSRGDGNQYLNF